MTSRSFPGTREEYSALSPLDWSWSNNAHDILVVQPYRPCPLAVTTTKSRLIIQPFLARRESALMPLSISGTRMDLLPPILVLNYSQPGETKCSRLTNRGHREHKRTTSAFESPASAPLNPSNNEKRSLSAPKPASMSHASSTAPLPNLCPNRGYWKKKTQLESWHRRQPHYGP